MPVKFQAGAAGAASAAGCFLVQLLQLVPHRHRLRGLERRFQLKTSPTRATVPSEPRFLRFTTEMEFPQLICRFGFN